LAIAILTLLLIISIATNVATLASARFHAVAFHALSKATAAFTANGGSERLLKNSAFVAVQNVGSRLKSRAIRNAVRNVAAVPAEAVPIGGVAAVVALTLSDVYDNCQTLKDLNELGRLFGHEQEDERQVCGLRLPWPFDK
jgi:hypothetical protein